MVAYASYCLDHYNWFHDSWLLSFMMYLVLFGHSNSSMGPLNLKGRWGGYESVARPLWSQFGGHIIWRPCEHWELNKASPGQCKLWWFQGAHRRPQWYHWWDFQWYKRLHRHRWSSHWRKRIHWGAHWSNTWGAAQAAPRFYASRGVPRT